MQFQIPQFIETEDKVVGPFSLKQFAYLVGTAGFAMVLYFILNTFVWVVIAVPLTAIGIALALIKINGQPLIKIVLAAARYYWQPQIYVWQPEHPQIQKQESADLSTSERLEQIVTGLALKSAWQQVATGSRTAPAEAGKRRFTSTNERYQLYRKITGDRRVARRVDYR